MVMKDCLEKNVQKKVLIEKHMSDSNFVADKERAINAVENDILLVVQNINGSIALIVSIIVLSVMVAQYDVLALVVLIIMVIVQNVFTKRGTSEGVELNKSLEMFKIKEAYFNKLFVDKNSSKEIRQWRLTDYIEGKRYWLNEEIKRKTFVYGLSRLIVSCGDFLDAILTEVMVINDMILFGT